MMHPRFHSSPKYSPGSSGGSFLADRNYTSNSNVKHDVTEEPLQMQDLESETIVKQRRELQLLIGELKDRDKELNEMVAAHHHQLSAWERDRNRVLDLEQKNDRLEVEIRKRNEQLRLLIQRLKVSESRQKKKDLLIDETKVKLVEAQHEIDASFTEKRELETMNDALNSSLSEISSKIGRLEANEQNFVTQLQLKEGDLVEAESEIREVKSKLRKAEAELNECRKNAAAAYVDMEQQKAKYKQCRAELDKTIAEMATKTGDLISARQELTLMREELQTLKRDLYASEEQVRRKEEFIHIQKSKQERTNLELAALRELYERQQQELSVLQSNLETSQEMLSKQEDRLNDLSPGESRKTVKVKHSMKEKSPVNVTKYTNSEAVNWMEKIIEEIKDLKEDIETSFKGIPKTVIASSSNSTQGTSLIKLNSKAETKPLGRLSCSERLAKILQDEYDKDSEQFRKAQNRTTDQCSADASKGKLVNNTVKLTNQNSDSTIEITEMRLSSCSSDDQTNQESFVSLKSDLKNSHYTPENQAPFPSGQLQKENGSLKLSCYAEVRSTELHSHRALDTDGCECSSQTTNDLLEEAQRSAEMDPLSMFSHQHKSPRVNIERGTSTSTSPTSKLQRLLSESREMVYNLERTALSPSPRSNYRSRSSERKY